MSYSFEIIGVKPVLAFFNYQQELENDPQRSKAYIGSYCCTLDAFIESTKMIPQKPQWNWDEVVATMINFWLSHEDSVRQWKQELDNAHNENLIIARVANLEALRQEFEHLFD
ncbi:hypothetical protein Xen7305DRAFT_00052700 [Xenococcus sp. PCC 7305]|uniref:hypothetical protein n=1 Tax=Xenococcus sp. PCC 7305 TaxID=102125 RepID=UPI0002ABA673|nr:hypothetical protein [Xenococcus sp. PCC 7305]ELS05524.1 hypothetical protein Xen7305DRAFT_00052700 [Xenococcus sp. PCC 7305]